MTRFVTLTRSGGINIEDGATCHPTQTGVESRGGNKQIHEAKTATTCPFQMSRQQYVLDNKGN